MKKVNVTIQGKTALLFNKFNSDAAAPKAKRGTKEEKSIEEQKRDSIYHENGEVYVPSTWISGTLREAGKNFKRPGKRATFKGVINSACFLETDKIPLGQKVEDLEAFTTSVVIPSTRGRIVKTRGMAKSWTLNFDILVDDELVEPSDIRAILSDAGNVVGIGDYRPAKTGPFGRFTVEKFEVTE